MSSMTANLKRIGAAALAATFIIGQFPLSAAASATKAKGAENDAESITITEFASLSDSVKTQKLYVGDKESDISFPTTLTATVIVSSGDKDEPASGDKEETEPGSQEGQESGGEGKENDQTTGDNAAQDTPSSESTTQGETGSDQSDNPSDDATGVESGKTGETEGQSEPATEGGSDSAYIGKLKDVIGVYMIPSVVYAQEDTDKGEEGSDKTTTKEIQIDGFTWKINADASSKESFSSEKAGYSFEYVAVLPTGYTTQAALPTIEVTIEKKNEEQGPSRKEYGTVEYKDDKGLSYTIDDYAAVLDSSDSVTWKDDWYVVGEDVEITGQINADGNVNLVLTDGHTLKISDARLVVEDEAVINIFGQNEGTGKLSIEYKKDDELPVISISDGDFTINGGVVEVSSEKSTAISADCVVINAGTVKANGKTGIVTKDKLTVIGGQAEFSSIGSETEKSGDVILDYEDEDSYVMISGAIYLTESGSVTIVTDKALTDGDVAFEGVYTATSEPAYKVLENKKLVHAVFEETPKATFTASGTQSAKLKGLVKEAEYEISGAGFEPTLITAGADGTYKIASGLKVGTFEIVKKKTENTVDSKPQTMTITKAENPSKLTAKACTTAENSDGKITGLDSTKKYEYRALSDTVYTAVSTGATSITGLKNGTYYVRLRPVGTMLASASLKVEVAAYTAKKVTTPTFSKKSGTYTGTQTITISSTTADAKIYYTTDGTTPTTNSSLYKGSITVDKSMTIKAFAVKEGMTNSSLASATYNITSATKKSTTTSGTTQRKTTGSTTKTTGTTKTTKSKSSTSGSLTSDKTLGSSSGSYSTGSSKSSKKTKSSASSSKSVTDIDSDKEYPMNKDDISNYLTHESEDEDSAFDTANSYEVPDITSNESDQYLADSDMGDMEVNDIYNEDFVELYDTGYGSGEAGLPAYIALFLSVASMIAVVLLCLKNKKDMSV